MLKRLLELPPDRSCLLFGPRQTGKTTLVRSALPEEAWSVDLLHHDLAHRYARDPAQFRREALPRIEGGASTIFVDEVQKVPELLDEVHSLIESTEARFILTGSSARKLRRGAANLLAGRAVTRQLHPLVMEEQGEFFDLERTLRLGSLPAIVTETEDAARDVLRSYGDTYLREEIQAEAMVRNLGGFARFLDVVASQCGEILNLSAIGRDASLATTTVQGYFEILEDTLLGFRLEAWRKSPRARMVARPRFYLFDTGVTNALNRRLTAELDRGRRGRLFEQWVILECLRRIDYRRDEARLFYWRTNVGTEVDLLIEKHGRLLAAIEIKAKERVVSADCTGLRSFLEVHPDVPGMVVCLAPEEFALGPLSVLPYQRFFERFEAVLEPR
jgi:predicted AAA+ superfamily ATPase